MKLTFEGNTMRDILDQIEDTLRVTGYNPENKIPDHVLAAIKAEAAVTLTQPGTHGHSLTVEGPGPVLEIIPEEPVDKTVNKPVDKPVAVKKAAPKKAAKPAAEPLDPAALAALQKRTVEELQAAYANGKQTEVFALLNEYGNGAKSFRELPMDAFVPIREAIDNGALS